MLFDKKIIFRYQNFKNKYIKNKSQIGKGNNETEGESTSGEGESNQEELNTNINEDFDLIKNDFTGRYFFDSDKYNLKLLSKLEDGTIPITQFPPRMVFCEDAIHDLGAISANILQYLPIIKNKLKEKGEDQSLDAIIKIENEKYPSKYNDGYFETIQKHNYISDHDGIVLKLNKKENTSSIEPQYINIISFNLEGLCRQNFTKGDEPYIDPTFAQRLELLDIHLRKYIDRDQSFILVCQEIVLQKKVNKQDHLFFLNDSCFRILQKLQEIRGSPLYNFKNDGYTSGIFYSDDILINDEIQIERYEKKSDDIIVSSEIIGNKSNEITKEKLKNDNVSSSSNNNQLKKKSNAYLINNDFWIVNIHLKALPTFNMSNIQDPHIDELNNIINKLFGDDKYKKQNVYLIGDFNHANKDDSLTLNLVKSAMIDRSVFVPEQEQVNQNP